MAYKDIEQRRAYAREYARRNREKMKANAKAWLEKNPGKGAEYTRRWQKKNPDKVKQHERTRSRVTTSEGRASHVEYMRQYYAKFPEKKLHQRMLKYGITGEDYTRMHKQQGGLCAICKKPETMSRSDRLSVDHCHTTGKVRGLLCANCNNGLGRFKDDPAALNAAARYIRKHQVK